MSPAAPGTPPPEPARGKDGERAGGERFDGERAAGECFGPLELRRIRKDDGRELIFFSDPREPA